jgi:glutathione S-transferase
MPSESGPADRTVFSRIYRLDRRIHSFDLPAERDETWYEQRLPIVEDRIRDRLSELSGHLGDTDWLDGACSAGDLLMVAMLRSLNGSEILHECLNLSAYVARGEGRPAFRRAFEAQLAVFTAASTG